MSHTLPENPAAKLRSYSMITRSTERSGRTMNQVQPNAQGNLNVTKLPRTLRFKQKLLSSKQL